MSLTFAFGPLAEHPAPGNYRIEGPAHRLFFDDFPRRVRGIVAGQTVLDTTRGKLLHETGLLPQLYVPKEDVRLDLLQPSATTTHCPFKGDARYWSLAIGNHVTQDAAWAYPAPVDTAGWLRGYLAFYWDKLPQWLDEDEVVLGHLRDPYHRVDIRNCSRHVQVVIGSEVIADTVHPRILSETGLPNRFYIPPNDVRADLLQASTLHTICPYKGQASYYDIWLGTHQVTDVAWYYPEPLLEAQRISGYVCFADEYVNVS